MGYDPATFTPGCVFPQGIRVYCIAYMDLQKAASAYLAAQDADANLRPQLGETDSPRGAKRWQEVAERRFEEIRHVFNDAGVGINGMKFIDLPGDGPNKGILPGDLDTGADLGDE